MKILTKNFLEEVLCRLDSKHLDKLMKIVPQKASGFSVIPKNPSKVLLRRLINQFTNEKNLNSIWKYIKSGNFHDILSKDMQVYSQITYTDIDSFFEQIHFYNVDSPFSFYIYLIEEKDEDEIEIFFKDINGIVYFRDRSFEYIKEKAIDSDASKKTLEFKKFETTIKELKLELVKTNNERKSLLKENEKLKKKIEKNNNTKVKEINEIKNKYSMIERSEKEKNENVFQNLTVEIKQCKEDFFKQNEKISELKKLLESKNSKIQELEDKVEFMNQKRITDFHIEKNVENKKNILLLGNPGKVTLRDDYNFEIISPNSSIEIINTTIKEKLITELWITNFQIKTRTKRKILQVFDNVVEVRELNDFTILMSKGEY